MINSYMKCMNTQAQRQCASQKQYRTKSADIEKISSSIIKHSYSITLSMLVAVLSLGLVACSSIDLNTPPHTIQDDAKGQDPQPQATNEQNILSTLIIKAPFELGEVIFRNEEMYREFWGMTDNGYYIVQDFYNDGKLKRTDPYILIHIEDAKAWFLDSDLAVTKQYEQLVTAFTGIDGAYTQWYSNGNKAIEGHYANQQPDEQWQLWYLNGNIMLQENWQAGQRNGVSKGWHENGQQAGEGSYINNVREGVWTVGYPNGVKMLQGSYSQGLQQGVWTQWYNNGKKQSEGVYDAGKQTGVWRWWTRTGEPARQEDFSAKPGSGRIGSGTIQPRAQRNY